MRDGPAGGQTGERSSYQRLLRAIGSYLDQEKPHRFTVIEVPDGFTVVLEPAGTEPTLKEVHFSRAMLLEKADQLMRGRRQAARDQRHVWAVAGTSYEDFFRALGFELDDSNAQSVLLDEIAQGLLITYSFLDPSQGYSWRKHMVTVSPEQAHEVLQAAYNRRQRKGLLGFIR